MKIGDVIDDRGTLGVVRRLDRQARLAVVQRADKTAIEVEDDLDQVDPEHCRVLYNPSEQWPFVKVPDRPRLGAIVGLAIAGKTEQLRLFQEWVPTEFGKTGSVFLNPTLCLGYGDVLLIHHEKGVARLDIPKHFASVRDKAAKPVVEPPAPYRRLLIDPEDQ